jgi:hypothetical protein
MNQWIMRWASVPAVGMVFRVACVALMVAACGTDESALDHATYISHDHFPLSCNMQEIPGDDRLDPGLHPEVNRNDSYVTRTESYNDAQRGTQKEKEKIRSFKQGQKWSFKNP